MGFDGTDRTTRRAVAAAKESFRAGHRRVHRPWIPEPGLWLQWDVRHEAPCFRGRWKTFPGRAVAAARLKLRAV